MFIRKFSWVLFAGLYLSACGGGSSAVKPSAPSSSSNSSSPVTSISTSSSSSSTGISVSVTAAVSTKDSRLACYKGEGEKACNLRIYQIMVESFIDADTSANMNAAYGNSHHKGDLQGVINSLDYIKSLGVNAIWLTPIFESVKNNGQDEWATRLDGTGYFASNYFKVDPRFGTAEKLKELVDAAHAKGLYVFLDGVFGHFKNNAQAYPSPTGKMVSTSGPSQGGVGREASYPADLAFFKEVASYWITEYKIDGWRLDQAYQVPVTYWDDLVATVQTASQSVTYTDANHQTVNPLGYMVAEIWRGENDISSQAYGTLQQPSLMSAFDFPLRYRLVQTLAVEESGAGKSPATTLRSGFQTHQAYPAHAMPNLMLGNHDLVRFGDLVQRGNLANPADKFYWARHKAAVSFLAAYSGPVTLYYGDEIGQEVPGYAARVESGCVTLGYCDDHVARSSAIVEGLPPMVGAAVSVLTPEQADLKLYVKNLLALREKHAALWNGSRTHIFSDSRVYIDRKEANGEGVLYVLNTSESPVIVTLATNALGSSGQLLDLLDETTYSSQGNNYTLQLQPLSARFFQIK
jgi:glycosidase